MPDPEIEPTVVDDTQRRADIAVLVGSIVALLGMFLTTFGATGVVSIRTFGTLVGWPLFAALVVVIASTGYALTGGARIPHIDRVRLGALLVATALVGWIAGSMIGAVIKNAEAADYIGIGLLVQVGGIAVAWGATAFFLHRHDRLFRPLLVVAIGSLVFGTALELVFDKSPFRDSDYTGALVTAADALDDEDASDVGGESDEDPYVDFVRTQIGSPVEFASGTYTVQGVARVSSVATTNDAVWDGKPPAGKDLFVVTYRYENTTKEPVDVSTFAPTMYAVDSEGAKYKASDTISDFIIEGNERTSDDLNPNDTGTFVSVIDLPKDMVPAQLILEETMFEHPDTPPGAIYELDDESTSPTEPEDTARASDTQQDCTGGTFTVSNIGIQDVSVTGITCAEAKRLITAAFTTGEFHGYDCGPGDGPEITRCTSGKKSYSYGGTGGDL